MKILLKQVSPVIRCTFTSTYQVTLERMEMEMVTLIPRLTRRTEPEVRTRTTREVTLRVTTRSMIVRKIPRGSLPVQ